MFILLVYVWYPETTNLTLREVDLLYTEKGSMPGSSQHDSRKTCRRKDGVTDGDEKLIRTPNLAPSWLSLNLPESMECILLC